MVSANQLSPSLSRSLSTLLERVKGGLRIEGYAYLTSRLEVEAYESLAAALGLLVLRTEICINVSQDQILCKGRVGTSHERPSPFRAAALDLHTDSPRIDVLSFYCIEQDEEDGSLILIDLSDSVAWFSREEWAALAKIKLRYTSRDPSTGLESQHLQPLHSGEDLGGQFYYAPWHLPEPADPHQARLMEKFKGYVANQQKHSAVNIRLLPGQAVFVDNRRMLHGRRGLCQDSKRHLVRLYIKTSAVVTG